MKRKLKGWHWWWDWIEMSIQLTDTSDKLNRIVEILDTFKPNGDDWDARYNAQNYKITNLK